MRNRWGSAVKRILLLILCVLLAACSVDMDTRLDLNEDQSGQRVVTVSVSANQAEEYGEQKLQQVEAVIASKKPATLDYEKKVEDDGTIRYIFTLSYSSLEDYRSKVGELIGREPLIVLSEPDTVFSSGITFTEDFSSYDLTQWFQDGLAEAGIEDDITGQFSQETTLVYKGEEYTGGSIIQVSEVETNPLDYIAMHTLLKEDGTYERTVEFILPQETYDENQSEIDRFFQTLTPQGAQASWVSELSYPDEYRELSEEQLDYCIRFSAADIEELQDQTNTVLHTTTDTITLAETASQEETSPYQLLQEWRETVDLSSFGSDSQGRVSFYYALQSEQGAVIYDSYDDGQTLWSTSQQTSLLDVTTQIKQYYPMTDIASVTQIEDETSFVQTFTLTYAGRLAKEGAQRAQEHLQDAYSEGVDISLEENDDGCVLTIRFYGEPADVIDRINSFLGVSYSSMNYSVEKKNFFSQNISFSCSMDLSGWKSQLGYDGAIHVSLQPRGGDSIERLTFGGQTMSDVNTMEFTSEDGHISFGYTASRMLWMNLLGGIIAFVVLLGVLLVASLFYVKRWAAKHGMETLGFAKQARAFYGAMLANAKAFLQRLWNNLRHVDQLFVFAGCDPQIHHYFYGKLYLLVIGAGIVLLSLVLVPLSVMPLLFALLAFLALFLYFLLDLTVLKHPEIEAQIDERIRAFANRTCADYLAVFGVESDALITDAVRLYGPSDELMQFVYQQDPSARHAARKRYPIATAPKRRKGSDGKWRYSLNEVLYLFMTEQELLIHRVDYNVVSDERKDQHSTEYAYRNVNGIFTGTRMIYLTAGKVVEERKVSYLEVIGFSGTKDTIFMENGEAILSNEIMALQNIIREKKRITEEEAEDE